MRTSPDHYSTVFESFDHERLYDEFVRLCELSAADRDGALRELRTANPELADELEGLLTADAREGSSRGLLTAAVWRAAEETLEGDRVGERIGRFVLLRYLGHGGMGVVYSAFDNELERRVAVKLIGSVRAGPLERDRLLSEARAMAKLSHPHVITVYEAGTVDNEVYIAMEHIQGPTLRGWVNAEPRSWREVIALYDGAAAGLAAAHAAGLAHHDFKPDNVLVDTDGRARVLDFGLARQLSAQPAEISASGRVPPQPTGLRSRRPTSPCATIEELGRNAETTTVTSVALGTPAYMAPEQIRGHRGDHRSDQFAFCASLYEALYGARPFRGDTIAELFGKLMRGELDPPPSGAQVPGWLRDVVLRGLRVDPAERWPSMDALRLALARDPYGARRLVAIAVGTLGLVLGAWGLASISTDDARMPVGVERPPRAVEVERLRDELATARTCLIAYDEPEYQGQSWVFCSDTDAPPRAAWDRRISSLRVPAGAVARLCTEADGGGRCLEVRDNAPWLNRALHTPAQVFEGFDDRISSVALNMRGEQRIRLLLTNADASDEAIASMIRVDDRGFTSAVVFANVDTVGSADAWQAVIQRFGDGTGLHLWPAWERAVTTSCWSTDCAAAAFRHLDHAIAGALPLSYDAATSESYGVLERERVHRGSMSYSWRAGSFRFVQLHERADVEFAHERWNPDDALRERVELSSALDWLEDELVRASREEQTAIVFVGDVTASLLDVTARHGDVAILSRNPHPEPSTGPSIRSSRIPSGAQFLYLDLEPDRVTAYAKMPSDEPVLLWHLDFPRGYQRWENAGIRLHDDRELEGLTAAECAAACDAETTFVCRSFDIADYGTCHLSADDSSQVDLEWQAGPWTHYERTIAADFELHPDAAIAGHNTRRIREMTVARCLAACRAETEFVCKSVDFDRHQKICDLSDKSAEEVGLKRFYRPFDHYARLRG